MAEPKKRMFREKALEQLSSPEQLEQLLRVVSRKSWLPISALGAGLLLAVAWTIWGEIPVTVDGQGILLYPRQVVSLQMTTSGQIVSLDVNVGDLVQKGEVLGRINQPELEGRLEQERLRLAELEARDRDISPLRSQRVELQKEALDAKRKDLLRLKQESERLLEALKERYEAYETLKSEGLTSDDVVLNARRSYIDHRIRLADLELQLREIEVRASQLEQQELEAESDAALEIHEVRRTVDRLEEDLKAKTEIVSEHAGRILEITAAVGQFLSAGQRIGSIETQDPGGELMAVAFFQVKDGKKVSPDMDIRICPTTVQRERFGSIVGSVSTVSRFPVSTEAVANVVGSQEVARGFVSGGSRIEVMAQLERDPETPSGFRWTSGRGPEMQVTAGTMVLARATVEYRRPITFLLPILREWSGT
jgi:HlyD family secretion protein